MIFDYYIHFQIFFKIFLYYKFFSTNLILFILIMNLFLIESSNVNKINLNEIKCFQGECNVKLSVIKSFMVKMNKNKVK